MIIPAGSYAKNLKIATKFEPVNIMEEVGHGI